MKKFKSMLKPKPNPTEQLKDWQRRLRQESRNIERQIRGDRLSFVLVKVSIFIEDLVLLCYWVTCVCVVLV